MTHVNVLLNGGVPDGLASYTTDITAVLDIGVILPTVVLAGVLMLKRKPFGIILSSTAFGPVDPDRSDRCRPDPYADIGRHQASQAVR